MWDKERNKSKHNINVIKGPETKSYIHLKLTKKVHVGVGGRCAPFRLKGTRNREEVIHITNTQKKRGKRGERGEKRDSRVGPKKEKKEKHIERGGKRENIFVLHYFKRNCINSRLQKYEPTRFRFLGNSNRNQFRLPPTLTGKSPNPTGTLTLFLGLCPTLHQNTTYW